MPKLLRVNLTLFALCALVLTAFTAAPATAARIVVRDSAYSGQIINLHPDDHLAVLLSEGITSAHWVVGDRPPFLEEPVITYMPTPGYGMGVRHFTFRVLATNTSGVQLLTMNLVGDGLLYRSLQIRCLMQAVSMREAGGTHAKRLR